MNVRPRGFATAAVVLAMLAASLLFAGKACKAFMKTRPGLEGLKLSFTFAEDLGAFEGTAVLIQYGGSGMTNSETRIVTRISGDLIPRVGASTSSLAGNPHMIAGCGRDEVRKTG